VVEDLATVVDPIAVQIIPAIQIEADDGNPEITPEDVTAEDFANYLAEALKGSSAGVAFWPWERITDEQKTKLKETLVLQCPAAGLTNTARLSTAL
jgi:hypothetical protein